MESLERLCDKLAILVENITPALVREANKDAPAEEPYNPVFFFLNDDGMFWKIFGREGDAITAGPENGKEALKFIESAPPYNAVIRLSQPQGWCVCAHRNKFDCEIPPPKRSPAKTPKPLEPQSKDSEGSNLPF